jgi:hypothetical protein
MDILKFKVLHPERTDFCHHVRYPLFPHSGRLAAQIISFSALFGKFDDDLSVYRCSFE